MSLRVQISLFAAIVSFALAVSALLRGGQRRSSGDRDARLFALFAFSVSGWYLATFLTFLTNEVVFARLHLMSGVLLPLAAVRYFRTFVSGDLPLLGALHRVSGVAALPFFALAWTPTYQHISVRTAILIYVGFFLFASLAMLYARARRATSRFERARIVFLLWVGGLAALFTIFEYLPLLGLDLPPFGTVLVLLFLYMLHQSVMRLRLIDLYELAGRLAVLTTLSFALAAVLWVLMNFAGNRYFVHAVVASLFMLVLYDPIREKIRSQTGVLLFRERFDLGRHVQRLRREVAHVVREDGLASVLVEGLERTRRVTHASVYLADEDLRRYLLRGHIGPEPIIRLEAGPAGPMLEALKEEGFISLEQIERQLEEQRRREETREAELLVEIQQVMEAMHSSLALAIQSDEGNLFGILSIRDDRMRDAFAPEEVSLLVGLATQAAIALENSEVYRRLQERDRLAALGAMSAGLAHEIRNPLGAIKASAQYLSEEATNAEPEDAEFLEIIVEEVDRLNRVVSSFLDYARPRQGVAKAIRVARVAQKAVQLMKNECAAHGIELNLDLDPTSEGVEARIDPEQLHQVLLNLVRNAREAMNEAGQTSGTIDMRVQASEREVQLSVRDNGPGIKDKVRAELFVPFVTTKDRGTGLGLAISQRIVSSAGGQLRVRSTLGEGATFVVRLPREASDVLENTGAGERLELGLESGAAE